MMMFPGRPVDAIAEHVTFGSIPGGVVSWAIKE